MSAEPERGGPGGREGRDRGPNVRFPPPLLFIAAFFVGMLLDTDVKPLHYFGPGGAPVNAQILGLAMLVLGTFVAAWGMITFRIATTPIVPMFPAATLVQRGPYRFSRNPMYVGMTVAYVGLTIALNTGWPVVLLPMVLYLLFVTVIRKEERHLAEKFGEEYEAYRRRVRRWV
jgi:protein-S-isoprenylcysteine O-methyltransferase Ste14